MVADTWRSNPGIVSLTGKRITLRRPNRDRSWVSTDGELAREKMPLDYRIMPRGLKLLIPPKGSEGRGRRDTPQCVVILRCSRSEPRRMVAQVHPDEHPSRPGHWPGTSG